MAPSQEYTSMSAADKPAAAPVTQITKRRVVSHQLRQMEHYLGLFLNGYRDYANYLWSEIATPRWHNYFYALLVVSVVFFLLEVLLPWRKNQPLFRKDFWLDAFYMFFNFFLFSLVAYNAASLVVVEALNDAVGWLTGGFDLQAVNPLQSWPLWAVLLVGFVVRDFVQWWIHRLLHRVEWLWKFHQIHHSIEEMGFAGHLRFHWMETVIYRTLEYLPLALLGIGLYDFFIIHLFTLAWGHYNHANFRLPHRVTGAIVGGLVGLTIGAGAFDTQLIADPGYVTTAVGAVVGAGLGMVLLAPLMPYLFNGPEMHLYHHARHLPRERFYGVNFGLTLAVWDYLFGTDYVPETGGEIALGFSGMEEVPEGFARQAVYGLGARKG